MEAVVRRADEIKNQARAIGKGLEHELPVTIDSLFPLGSLAETLKEFDAEFPTVQIHIKVEAMGAVQSDVLDTRSAIGIIGSLPYLPAGLIGDAVTSVTRFPVAARDHPLAQGHPRKRLPQRLLLDHIQILQSDRSNLTLGRDFTVYTGRTWRVTDLVAKRTLICNGIGWGYMPQHNIAEDIASGLLRRVWVENLRDQNTVAFLVARRRDRVLGPAAGWLLSRLIKTKSKPGSMVMNNG
jgi:DNA-binding transcriptional LysR family regulator